MSRNRPNAGFTLIEMLIALAMMATIVSMVYGSYAVTSQSMEAYNSRLACVERASLVLRLMARQIRGAYAPSTDPNEAQSFAGVDFATERAKSGRRSRTLVERSQPIFQGGSQHPHGEVLSFATTTGLASGLERPHGLSQVRYRHDPVTHTLWIDCQPYRDRFGKTDLAQAGRPILEHVIAVDIAFHDGRKWLREWSGPKSRELPRAVRIDLNLADERGRSYQFGTTVSIFSRVAVAPAVSKQRMGSGPR